MMQQVERVTPVGQDPVLDLMISEGLPLTETVYLEMQFPEGVPTQVPLELKAAMPPEVQGGKKGGRSSTETYTPPTGLVDRVAARHKLTPEKAEELLKAFGVS